MEYWEGYMNWPLKEGWKCETCGSSGPLQWGLVNGQCRCEQCQTQYHMRDEKNEVTDTPICQLKEECKQPAKALWEKLKTPMEEWEDSDWDSVMVQ